MFSSRLTLTLIGLSIFATACGTSATREAEPSTVARVTTSATVNPQSDAMRALASALERSIQFDYDSFEIKAEYRDLLVKYADLIKKSEKAQITLEGHADERGSGEYNLALGQKRAEAVKRSLTLLGVKDSAIEAISFGKEKPKATCHDESCWSQNRRVEFSVK